MIDKIIAEFATDSSVKVVITCCASKVPVGGKLYATNGDLAKARSIEAEINVRKALKARGFDHSKLEFKVFYKVRGPEYKGDYIENREQYEQFQYTKIYVK